MNLSRSLALVVALAVPAGATAQNGLLRDAERLAAGFTLQRDPSNGGGPPVTKIITTVALIGAGIGVSVIAKPDYVPSQFVPGNYPNRVDISTYLGPGSYPGHSYRVVHRRGSEYGRGHQVTCGGLTTGICRADTARMNELLRENYNYGYTDGFDDGAWAGAVFGHEEGFRTGQESVIQIMDRNGFVVYDGEFTPASYVQERFSDKEAMRIGGVGLAAAGALIALLWPNNPAARNLDVTPLPSGGRVDASFGF